MRNEKGYQNAGIGTGRVQSKGSPMMFCVIMLCCSRVHGKNTEGRGPRAQRGAMGDVRWRRMRRPRGYG